MQTYHDHSLALGGVSDDIHVTVLKTGYWPGFQLLQNVTLPVEMARCINHFGNFFTSREPSKKVSLCF